MFKVLSKYGLTKDCINVIKQMYKKGTIWINLLKEEVRDIIYGNGVQQGDNMSLILFIYIIHTVSETLQKHLGERKKPESRYFPDSKQRGRFIRQPTNLKGTVFHADNLLYIDDGVFLSDTWEEAGRMTQKIYTHLACFSPQMHIGSENQKSKPKPSSFHHQWRKPKRIPSPHLTSYSTMEKTPLHHVLQLLGLLHQYRLEQQNRSISQNQKCQHTNGNATRLLLMQRHWYQSQILDMHWRTHNTVLWGAKTWSITDKILRKIREFHHMSIRRILGIRMDKVQECHIMNEQAQHWFLNIPPIDNSMARRT